MTIPPEKLEPPIILPDLTPEEWADLRLARTLLENPGLAARLANIIGAPIEKGFALLPRGWTALVHKATQGALIKALSISVLTLGRRPGRRPRNLAHKVAVAATGGLGGAFGLAALPVELPVSTTLILRSVAEIARSEGLDLRDLRVRLACLEVFALGGRSERDDAAENAYWAVRSALAKSVSEAAAYLAKRGIIDESAPAIVRLVANIASRFGVVVSEQAAAKAVPVLGAAVGSTINVTFMSHFQNMARGHFIIRRLEARYGSLRIQRCYESMAMPMT